MATSSQVVAAEAPLAPKAYVDIDRVEVLRVAILGVVSGIVVPLLGTLLANYFIKPVFCQSAGTFSVCSSGGIIAYHIAGVIAALAAIALVVNWGVFRPLLIVAAVTIAMWGLKKYVDPLTSGNVVEYYAFSAMLYGISYVLFYWLLRLRNFAASLVLSVLGVVLVCWALVA